MLFMKHNKIKNNKNNDHNNNEHKSNIIKKYKTVNEKKDTTQDAIEDKKE